MDTSESMKSETPQPAIKEQSPQKEQIENNITGMSRQPFHWYLFLHTSTRNFVGCFFFQQKKMYFDRTQQSKIILKTIN